MKSLTLISLPLVGMAAAKLAEAGESLPSILEETQKAISQVRMLGLFDTMKYLVLSERVSKPIAAMADILHIKPMLTFNNGEIVRGGLVPTYANGMDKLYEFAKNNHPTIQDLAIAYSTVPERASQLKERLAFIVPEERVHVVQLGAALGVHGGSGVLLLAIRQSDYK